MKTKHFFLTFGFVLTSIVSTYFATISVAQQSSQPAPARADNEYQVAAVLYMQTAAEYRALCYQAYNFAKRALDDDFDKKNLKKMTKDERKKTRAVMVDIDETVLDNSPQQADLIKRRAAFNLPDWYAWGKKQSAKAVPGAVDFLNYAHSKGVKIFYVSNRDEVQKPETMNNLKAAGFPDVTAETVLLRQLDASGKGISSKEPRRILIQQTYRIVLFAGDNLDDSAQSFESKSIADRFAETDKARDMFGKKYIVLPNAMYGTWENALYGPGRLNEVQKAEKRLNALQLP